MSDARATPAEGDTRAGAGSGRGRPIYLDHHATTPVDPRVLEAMAPYWSDDFGNAASRTHVYGWRAEAAVESARECVAGAIGASSPREIVWTSGATESDNLALLGVLRGARGRRDGLVTVATEHRAVLDAARALTREGVELTFVPVDGRGLVDPEDVARAIGPRTALVSVMAANNEIGVLQPIAEIAAACRAREVPFHSDGAQAVGKIPLDVQREAVDLLSLTAHKIYGPKGIGALYVRDARPRLRIEPLVHGGGHERGLRSGTIPVPLVVGFARALSLAVAEREAEAVRQGRLRDRLWSRLEADLRGLVRSGDPARSLPGSLHVCFEGIASDALLASLPDVALSSGSACSSARPEPSHVLAALGVPADLARGAVRFGLGRGTTEAEIDRASSRVVEAVTALRAAREGRGASPVA